MTEYTLDELDLDLSTAEWQDRFIWVEGTSPDGRDISVGFDPVNIDPIDGPDAKVVGDGLSVRCFARPDRVWFYDEREFHEVID